MPYMHCPSCRLATFTAAAHLSREQCPRCGTTLEPHPRRLFAVPDADAKLVPAAVESPPEVA